MVIRMKNGQIFDFAKTPKTTEKHPNHYKSAHFSFLCRRKNYILNAYAGVRNLCSSWIFGTKKHPFQSAFLFYGFKTAIQLHQHMLVQAVDKLAALAVVVDSSVAAVAADKPVAAVQAVEPVELAD